MESTEEDDERAEGGAFLNLGLKDDARVAASGATSLLKLLTATRGGGGVADLGERIGGLVLALTRPFCVGSSVVRNLSAAKFWADSCLIRSISENTNSFRNVR